MVYRYFLIYALLVFSFSDLKICAQIITSDDSLVSKSIEVNDITYIDQYIKRSGVDGTFLGNSHTILSFAVCSNSFGIVKYILNKGASINLIINNMSPLMHCAVNDRYEIAAFLLKNGAVVDLYNTHRNTALLYASRYGNLNTLKVLTQKRANPFLKNFVGYNSLDYAIEFHKYDVAEYLKDYMMRYAKGAFPSTTDGPYLEQVSFNKFKAFYLLNDSLSGRLSVKNKYFRFNENIKFSGFIDNDTNSYEIFKNIDYKFGDTFFNVPKVFVVGDVHGSYDSLRTVLIANNVIDRQNNWIFSNSHLVFIGDLFDKGDKVTELLWLVYRLWNQSIVYGGKVHVLLGNHELLALNRDYRYLNEKYVYLTRGLDIEYSNLFSQFTVLGNFVRSFKVAVKIDSVLFVHAGFSKYFVDRGISLSEVNQAVNLLLNRTQQDFMTERTISVFSDAVSDKGPFWYRGYMFSSATIPRETHDDIEAVLKYYSATTMVIGHTEVSSIDSLYNGRLIPVNVPFDRVGVKKQALLISNRKFYRCYSDGSCDTIM